MKGSFHCTFAVAACLAVPQFLMGAVRAAGESSPAVADRAPAAVVQLVAVGPAGNLQNRACAATGFLIDEEGYLITNAHVVEDAQRCLENAPGAKIFAKPAGNTAPTAPAFRCDVIATDTVNDLALLKLERPLEGLRGASPYMMLDRRSVGVGTPIRVTGYPAFSWQAVTSVGRVDDWGKTPLEVSDRNLSPADAVLLDLHLRPGNSGSPVYREGGGVIAVVDMRDSLRPSYSVAIAIRHAIELAERYGARWHGVD